jgi:hypothetical protein
VHEKTALDTQQEVILGFLSSRPAQSTAFLDHTDGLDADTAQFGSTEQRRKSSSKEQNVVGFRLDDRSPFHEWSVRVPEESSKAFILENLDVLIVSLLAETLVAFRQV